MKAVTIDNLDIKDHLRWAQDQEILDTVWVEETNIITSQPEIMGMSMIFPSKLEELFELQRKNQHWASFCPPKNFHLFGKHFFSYRLFSTIHWENEEFSDTEEGSEEDSKKQQKPNHDLIQAVLHIKTLGNQSSSLFEKDKTAVLNLLESIQWINELLGQIHGLKLQYQKG